MEKSIKWKLQDAKNARLLVSIAKNVIIVFIQADPNERTSFTTL